MTHPFIHETIDQLVGLRTDEERIANLVERIMHVIESERSFAFAGVGDPITNEEGHDGFQLVVAGMTNRDELDELLALATALTHQLDEVKGAIAFAALRNVQMGKTTPVEMMNVLTVLGDGDLLSVLADIDAAHGAVPDFECECDPLEGADEFGMHHDEECPMWLPF